MKDIAFIDVLGEYFPRTKIFKRKELFLGTDNGMLFFVDLLGDRTSSMEPNDPVIQRIHLSDGKEKLVHYQIREKGQGIVFQSNLGEVYVIDKPSLSKITADKLMIRTSGNALFGLIQTSDSSSSLRYTHVLTLSSKD